MYNLSKPQQTIYDMSKVIGGSISTICGSVLKHGAPDTALLKKCVNELYRLNDALRIHIRKTNGQPMQYFADYAEKDIEVLHFDSENDFTEYANSLAQRHISLYDDLAQICEICAATVGDKYGIVFALHHIIRDAWTATLLAEQFIELVEGTVPSAYSYIEYLDSEQKYINSGRYETDKKYWPEEFSKCDEVTYLNEHESKDYSAKRATYIIGKEKTAQIQSYIKNHKASVYSLFMTLFAVYMNRIKFNREKFYIGTTVLNRRGVREKNTLGMYINTVPLLIDIKNEDTFAECLKATPHNKQ